MKALEKILVEIEYNEDLDEHFITIPESVLLKMGWEEGSMLDFDVDDEILRIFKI